MLYRLFFLLRTTLVLLGVGALSACSVYNTTKDGEVSNLMLQGHDPISFFSGKPVRGSAQFKATHEIGTYYFASEANRAAFVAAPAKYAPQYGGFCSDGVAYDMKAGGDVATYKVYQDKLYIFGGQGSYEAWALDADKNVKLADAYWKDGLATADARMSFYKRLVFRVPHYRSGKDLGEEVAARKKAGTFPKVAGVGAQ